MRDVSLALRVSALILWVCMVLPARTVTVHVEGRGRVSFALDDYVAAVLSGEMGGFRSKSALEAMAVASRTYAVKFLGRHAAEGFDFCDTTHCQDYRPGPVGTPIAEAAEATSGECLWYRGTLASTYYTQSCGGTSEDVSALWPDQRAPYLVRHSDAYCPQMTWRSGIRKADLDRALGFHAGVITIPSRTASGRAASVRAGARLLPSAWFRFRVGRSLGWNLIRSDWFEISDGGDRWEVSGRGGGHGVGLCQTGAEQMGKAGKSYREILAFYYPGTVPGLNATGVSWRRFSGERVEVLAAAEGHGRVTLERAERAAAEIEQQAGRRYTRRPVLRLYPTAAAFRDATGEPGWIAASTRGHAIRLQPGSNDGPTLLHELAHAMVESRARPGLPLWFREGLALYLAGARGGAANAAKPPAVPGDAAFASPASRAELERCYAASGAAVRFLISRYGREAAISWMEKGIPPEAVRAVTPDRASR